VTWLVNSACHKWGYRNFEIKDDLSTCCWWVAILSFGEGWHNNHHKYAKKSKYGLKLWEIDLTWVSIWILDKIGLLKVRH
jgi:stearoyl-CoA desaturase (delta-9 desaturase)